MAGISGFEGPVAGMLGYQSAMQDLGQGQLNQELTRGQIAGQAVLAQESQARAAQIQQQTAAARAAAEREQAKLRMMQSAWPTGGPGGGTPSEPQTAVHGGAPDPIGTLESQIQQRQEYAINLAKAGLFEESGSVLKGVTEEFHKLGQIRSEIALRRERDTSTSVTANSQVNQILTGVSDEKTFSQAKMMLVSAFPNQPLPGWMGLPYAQAKPYIDQANRSTKEAVEQGKAKSEIAKNRAVEAEQNALARLNKARAQIEELELKVQQERIDAAKKAGEALDSVKRSTKKGGATQPGVRPITAAERMNADQMIRAGNEIYTGFDEILKLGPTGLGAFADVAYTKDPTFIGGVKRWLGNKITADEEHMYAARLAGVNVAAAIVASGGRAPRVSQMEAEQAAIASLKGQSRHVYFDKIHQATLKAIRGIEITRAGDEEQQGNLNLIMERLKTIEKQTADALKITSNFDPSKEPAKPAAKPNQAPAVPALPPGFTLDK